MCLMWLNAHLKDLLFYHSCLHMRCIQPCSFYCLFNLVLQKTPRKKLSLLLLTWLGWTGAGNLSLLNLMSLEMQMKLWKR